MSKTYIGVSAPILCPGVGQLCNNARRSLKHNVIEIYRRFRTQFMSRSRLIDVTMPVGH